MHIHPIRRYFMTPVSITLSNENSRVKQKRAYGDVF